MSVQVAIGIRTEIEVDRMSPEEAEAVSQLVRQIIFSPEYDNQWARREEMARYLPSRLIESAQNDPDSVLVAKNGDEIIGFCLSEYEEGVIWLAWFGVDPQRRGHGVGSALLSVLERTVHPRGCHKIWCDTLTTNEASHAVLARRGYSRICILRNHWYGQDTILWEKFVD